MSSEEINFTYVSGNNKSHKVKLYALSTCGFCKRALAFLRKHSIEFEFVFVDLLDRPVVGDLREKLKEKSGFQHVGYPFLILDEDNFLVGFDEENYKVLFGID